MILVMKKVLLFLFFSLLVVSSLFSSYSISLGQNEYGYVRILDEGGDVISLDDSVWFKKWNGLVLERIGTWNYKITEPDGSQLIVITRRGNFSDVEFELSFSSCRLLVTERMLPSIDALEGSPVKEIIVPFRVDELTRRTYAANGIKITEIRPSDLIDVENGIYIPSSSDVDTIFVRCPDCGRMIEVQL